MMINISIRIEDGRAILNDLNYYGANLIDDKAFVQIAEITGQTLDAYTAMIDGILAANKGEMPKQDLTQALNTLQPEAVGQAPAAPEPEPEPAKEEKPVTVEEVRKALIEVKKTKGPEGLKVCFEAVGTKSLSATDPAQYGALLAKAQEVLHAQ